MAASLFFRLSIFLKKHVKREGRTLLAAPFLAARRPGER
jgi:hypothetical protein